MDTQFKFTLRYKLVFIILILIGLVAVALSLFTGHDHGMRFWTNFHLNTYYFLAMGLSGMVFLAIHSLGTSGWQVALQRVPEAMSMFLPVGGILMLIILVGLWFEWHHLFHWVHPEGDKILELKKAYLNIPFFSVRSLVYLGGWILLTWWWRRLSLMQDQTGDLKYYKKTNVVAGIFIVFFAITSSTSAWDWLMSLDPHWFSTLYGWYVFSGLLVSGIAVIILLVIFLNQSGFLPGINKEHLHDLGKYLFAFSILWTYLWFSQYMLIWYSNIPEETVYFVQRINDFKILFFVNVAVNFIVPFLVLMTRNSKRTPVIMVFAALIVIAGHWLDYYLMIMPGTTGNAAKIGFIEIGMTIGFAGLFLWFVFRSLSKAKLVPENHPFLRESYEYHTQY